MIELYVKNQSLTITTPVIAADSLKYLCAKVYFTTPDWDGLTKWAHFRRGDTVYDLKLNAWDEIDDAQALNLTEGEWTVCVTGSDEDARITTTPVTLTVKPSGLVDSPLHTLPLSVLEQLSYRVDLAIRMCMALRGQRGIVIKGFYDKLSALANAERRPCPGDAFAVGEAAPYRIYIWDAVGKTWVDMGALLTAVSEGEQGVTFVPSVDAATGVLSWTNDGDLENPDPIGIVGEPGAKGDRGDPGKDAFTEAQGKGFTGTEAQFYEYLASFPQHALRHQSGGADKLTVDAGMLATNAVTGEKILAGAVSALKTNISVPTSGWSSTAPYTNEIAVSGISVNDHLFVDVVQGGSVSQPQLDAWAAVYRVVGAQNKVTLYASEKPDTAFTIQILAVKK